jgi:hypothetical protein
MVAKDAGRKSARSLSPMIKGAGVNRLEYSYQGKWFLHFEVLVQLNFKSLHPTIQSFDD